jgi:hypothetical protein
MSTEQRIAERALATAQRAMDELTEAMANVAPNFG